MASHRIRRGVVVEIPVEWRGVLTTKKTIRERKTARISKRATKKSKLRRDSLFHWNSQTED